MVTVKNTGAQAGSFLELCFASLDINVFEDATLLYLKISFYF